MKIPKPKNLSVSQIGLAIALGIISGIYIYKPFFITSSKTADTADKGR